MNIEEYLSSFLTHVPEEWRAKRLSKIKPMPDSCYNYWEDLDYWLAKQAALILMYLKREQAKLHDNKDACKHLAEETAKRCKPAVDQYYFMVDFLDDQEKMRALDKALDGLRMLMEIDPPEFNDGIIRADLGINHNPLMWIEHFEKQSGERG